LDGKAVDWMEKVSDEQYQPRWASRIGSPDWSYVGAARTGSNPRRDKSRRTLLPRSLGAEAISIDAP